MAKLTPSPAKPRETRPGLSGGINLRRKRRGGAPRGEPPPYFSPQRGKYGGGSRTRRCGLWTTRLSALHPLVFLGGPFVGLAWQNSGAHAPRERICMRDCESKRGQ